MTMTDSELATALMYFEQYQQYQQSQADSTRSAPIEDVGGLYSTTNSAANSHPTGSLAISDAMGFQENRSFLTSPLSTTGHEGLTGTNNWEPVNIRDDVHHYPRTGFDSGLTFASDSLQSMHGSRSSFPVSGALHMNPQEQQQGFPPDYSVFPNGAPYQSNLHQGQRYYNNGLPYQNTFSEPVETFGAPAPYAQSQLHANHTVHPPGWISLQGASQLQGHWQ